MQKKPHADNLSRISSREKYSACNPKKTPYVIYDNHQGVTHILEAPVCIAISLSQHSVKYKLWSKKYEFVSLHTNLHSTWYSKDTTLCIIYISISSISIFLYFYIFYICYIFLYIFLHINTCYIHMHSCILVNPCMYTAHMFAYKYIYKDTHIYHIHQHGI